MRQALLQCESYNVHPLCEQVEQFVADLDSRGRTQLRSAIHHAVIGLQTGRFGGRCERVKGTDRLIEIKITPPGTRGPQLRLLAIVEGRRILVARGCIKSTPELARREINQALAVLKRARDEPDEGETAA